MILAAALALAASAGCEPAATDRRWVEEARAAWRLQLRRIPELVPPPRVSVILFDRRCRWVSSDALGRQGQARWAGTVHGGRVLLADGSRIPARVVSLAGESNGGGPSFAMALPSVWAAEGSRAGPVGLDRLTKAVLLHEASHVAQGRLLARVGALVRTAGFGSNFDDDSIQRRFERNAAFSASMKEETRLLFAAAGSSDDAQSRRLASAALDLIKARRARWFRGADARLIGAEDLFLSLEGAGQYVGFTWLIDPAGGAMPSSAAMAGFGQRGRWWSQLQGLALVLAVERLGLPGWRRQLWGTPQLIGTQLLDEALRKQVVSARAGGSRGQG